MENQNKEKNNEKKQIILMILCVFILIIAVIGVSTAFFTFFKEGSTDNVITTGKIVFNFDNDKTAGKVNPETGEVTPGDLVVTNDEPMSDDEGKARDDKFGFDIDAKLPPNVKDGVDFKVYVIAGDVPTNETYHKPDAGDYEEADRLDYKYISMYVEPNTFTSTEGDDVSSTIVAKYKTGDYKLGDTTEGKKVLIAEGTIPGDNKEHIFAYMLSMWINEDIEVSDTNAKAPYRASSVEKSNLLPAGLESDDRKVYSDMFFSLKIRIEAGDAVGIGG